MKISHVTEKIPQKKPFLIYEKTIEFGFTELLFFYKSGGYFQLLI